jgi:ubiquitin-protein ligase
MNINRLNVDFRKMQELVEKSQFITMEYFGNPPNRYIITYRCKGLVWYPSYPQPSITIFHKMEIYLHNEYPRKPPQLKWLTEIFHPNILSLSENGGVCIGGWTPSETLDMLCVRVGEMVQYKNYSLKDALNKKAEEWVKKNSHKFPVDDRNLI